MTQFRFVLQKTVSWFPRFRQKQLVVFVETENMTQAREQIKLTHPDWETSMLWPVYPKKLEQPYIPVDIEAVRARHSNNWLVVPQRNSKIV